MKKHVGYTFIFGIADILSGKEKIDIVRNCGEKYSPGEIATFAYAPITFCDIERSFSRYKAVLDDNKRSLTFDNLRMVFVSYCNAADNDQDNPV